MPEDRRAAVSGRVRLAQALTNVSATSAAVFDWTHGARDQVVGLRRMAVALVAILPTTARQR